MSDSSRSHPGAEPGPPRAQAPAARGPRPNLLVITSDDQTPPQFAPRTMPRISRFFAGHGTVFTQALSDPPLCCPSRAGFLTGQYPHNHGVETNDEGYSYLRDKDNVLPVWLRRAGYRTMLVGKYLNGAPRSGPRLPPGWDFFWTPSDTISYRDFEVTVNGTPRHYGEADYSTDVYTAVARRQLARAAGKPWFMWLTYNAPHTQLDGGGPPCDGEVAEPASAADYRRLKGMALPNPAARAESDLADKGRWIRRRGALSPQQRAAAAKAWRCSLGALPAIDRGVGSILRELRDDGELDDTVIVFVSDNGYYFGEHGIPTDKQLPYEPGLHVPMAMAVPARLGGQTAKSSDSLVSNVDLAPTLLDYSGVRPCRAPSDCRELDGRSLRPLLAGESPAWTEDRVIPIELAADFRFRAMRAPGSLFMTMTADRLGRLPGPESELYDLRSDPDELNNLLADPDSVGAEVRRKLAATLRRVTSCHGTSGPPTCP